MQFKTEHRIEIDGLRSLAILPVLFYHAGLAPFSGGFVGVDVFFVISGFLITSLLMSELSSGKFSLLTFYERRARRILPALFFVMAVTLLVALPWMLPNDLQDLFLSFLGVSTFSSNILFWLQSGYFEAGIELKPMLHTWSLAVEEQYYVLFPLLLLWLWRFGINVLGVVILSLCCASFALTFVMQSADNVANFYLLPTRAWELMLGSLSSALYASIVANRVFWQRHGLVTNAMSLLGIAMIFTACFVIKESTPFPGIATLLPTLGTCLVLIFAAQDNVAGKLLSIKPIVIIGLISYSTYLWHQPILALARLNHIESFHLLWAIPASLVLGYLSWRFVEAPFRNRRFLTRNTILFLAVTLSAAWAIAGFVGYKSDGLPFRLDADKQHIARFTQYPSQKLYRQDTCFLQPGIDHTSFADECYQFASEQNKHLLWGDSHAAALSMGFNATEAGVAQLTSSTCPPLLLNEFKRQAACTANNAHILEFIKQSRPDTLWLHANWIDYKSELPSLEATITKIQTDSPETKIVLLGGVPQWKPTLPHSLLKQSVALGSIKTIDTPLLEYLRPIDSDLQLIARQHRVSFVSLIDELCVGPECKATASTTAGELEPMAWDAGHLTLAGSVYTVTRILQRLSR